MIHMQKSLHGVADFDRPCAKKEHLIAALFVHELKTCSIGSASLVQEPNVEIDLGLKMPEAAGNASDALVTQERS